MEDSPHLRILPHKTTILYAGLSIAMFDYRRVNSRNTLMPAFGDDWPVLFRGLMCQTGKSELPR